MNAWTKHALLILIALVLLIAVGASLAYNTLYQRYDRDLALLNARAERLQGIINAGADIEQNLQTAQQTTTAWLHPATENAPNGLQQRLRELIATSGGTLVSSQAALEPATEGQIARVRLTATITGEWAQLMQLLQNLQHQRPPYWSSSASLMREGANTAEAPQTARITLQLDAPLAPAMPEAPTAPEGSTP